VRLYRTTDGNFVEQDGQHFRARGLAWDALLSREDLPDFLAGLVAKEAPSKEFHAATLLAPIEH